MTIGDGKSEMEINRRIGIANSILNEMKNKIVLTSKRTTQKKLKMRGLLYMLHTPLWSRRNSIKKKKVEKRTEALEMRKKNRGTERIS